MLHSREQPSLQNDQCCTVDLTTYAGHGGFEMILIIYHAITLVKYKNNLATKGNITWTRHVENTYG